MPDGPFNSVHIAEVIKSYNFAACCVATNLYYTGRRLMQQNAPPPEVRWLLPMERALQELVMLAFSSEETVQFRPWGDHFPQIECDPARILEDVFLKLAAGTVTVATSAPLSTLNSNCYATEELRLKACAYWRKERGEDLLSLGDLLKRPPRLSEAVWEWMVAQDTLPKMEAVFTHVRGDTEGSSCAEESDGEPRRKRRRKGKEDVEAESPDEMEEQQEQDEADEDEENEEPPEEGTDDGSDEAEDGDEAEEDGDADLACDDEDEAVE